MPKYSSFGFQIQQLQSLLYATSTGRWSPTGRQRSLNLRDGRMIFGRVPKRPSFCHGHGFYGGPGPSQGIIIK